MARKQVEFALDKKDERELLRLVKGMSSDMTKKRVVQDAAVKGFNPTLIKQMRANAKRYWNTSGDTYKSIGFVKSRNKASGNWYVDFGVRIGGKKGSRAAGWKQHIFEKGTVHRETKAGHSRGRITDKRPVFWPAYYSQRDKASQGFAENLWDAVKKNWNRRKKGR